MSDRDILSLGSSRPWPEVIRIMTRGRTDKLDARPLLEYFKPLSMWLNLQNRDESLVGWSTTGEDTGMSSSRNTPWLVQGLEVLALSGEIWISVIKNTLLWYSIREWQLMWVKLMNAALNNRWKQVLWSFTCY